MPHDASLIRIPDVLSGSLSAGCPNGTTTCAHREGALSGLLLLSRPRLSVQPVSDEHAAFILGLEAQAPPPESPKRVTKKARKEDSS